MPRRSHPFAAKPGRPANCEPVKPVKMSNGEVQGVSPMSNFKSTMPAVPQFRKGGMVRHHDDPAFCSGGTPRRR